MSSRFLIFMYIEYELTVKNRVFIQNVIIKPMSLFEVNSKKPLADLVRPKKLKDVIGQDHIAASDGLIYKLIKTGKLTSIILWGPPGSGKTTIARIISKEIKADFIEVSAVSMGKKEVREAIDKAKEAKHMGRETILFVDEIHRFNKAQQDMFLPYVEDGTITLIGATTENPSFEVIAPLLSRSKVVVLNELSEDSITKILNRSKSNIKPKTITPSALRLLAKMAQGDARSALGGLEISSSLVKKSITKKDVEIAMQQVGVKYDKDGEQHYNVISAYIKSMRGSDSKAALYYLHRMIKAGEDPKFIARRIVIFASEDIGMASPHALTLAVAAFQSVERIGLPEGEYTLSQATIAMCEAKKSREVADKMSIAKKMVKEYPNAAVPIHLRNAPTKMMKDLGYGKEYKWEADFKHKKGFLPVELVD